MRISGEDFAVPKKPAVEHWTDRQHTSSWRRELQVWELVLLVAVGGVLFDITQRAFSGWHTVVADFGDNAAYLQAAEGDS